ncbi:hypothetical protein CK203_102312 [Vitis vinifera]|uniref:Uncharacterized protein n=1 Tax=Vitis vinifera TaxID=29760 RepID=A0A438DC89_VITVI|nr:hypothetical protein CK203_102312 [Vitis vinifera]
MGWTFRGTLSREGQSLTFRLHLSQEGIHVEATLSKLMMIEPSFTAGPSSQPSFTELPYQHLTFLIIRLEWMSPLRSALLRLKATFEHLQQCIDHIESRQASQHEEMMAYLHSVFPPPSLQP